LVAGKSLNDFFNRFVNGTEPIEAKLAECLDYFGLQYKKETSDLFYESHLGFRLQDQKVWSVFPYSVAERAGLSVQDELLAINGIKLENNLSEWVKYFREDQIELTCMTAQAQSKSIKVECSSDCYYATYKVSKQLKCNEEQKLNYANWLKG
jgi:predicted metalloprotease with PDZ domain